MEAKKSLSNISCDRSNWIAQYRQEIFERDWISTRREGIAQGAARQKAEDEKLLQQKDALLSSKDSEIARLKELLAKK